MNCSEEDAELIYHDAALLNLTGSGYVWIVTEQALLPPNTPKGQLHFYQVFLSSFGVSTFKVVFVDWLCPVYLTTYLIFYLYVTLYMCNTMVCLVARFVCNTTIVGLSLMSEFM